MVEVYEKQYFFEIVYVVVNHGNGSKILKKAKEFGLSDCGTVFLGRGTINNAVMKFLSLYDERKEIVMFGTTSAKAKVALPQLTDFFKFHKANYGIAFTIGMNDIIGLSNNNENVMESDEVTMYYQMIMTIVNRGSAEDVIDAATQAGSQGGTIMNARGSGIHETGKLFNMEIEPEKEMVMILSKVNTTEAIVSAIREALQIDIPGNGVIFVQDVKRIYGVYHD